MSPTCPQFAAPLSTGSAHASRDVVTSMQRDALLAQLEAEEAAGWPDLLPSPRCPQEALVRILSLVAAVVREAA